MIDINDYLLIQDDNNNYYKIKIESLEDIFVTKVRNTNIDGLFSKINEISAYILELSAQISKDYSTIDSLKETYETIENVKKLDKDTTILSENDIRKYLSENNYITLEKTQAKYFEENNDAHNIFESVDKTITDWTNH